MSVHAVRMTSIMVMSLERWMHAQAGEQAHVILGEGAFKIHFACDRQPGALDFEGSAAQWSSARVLDLFSPFTILMSIFSGRPLSSWKKESSSSGRRGSP